MATRSGVMMSGTGAVVRTVGLPLSSVAMTTTQAVQWDTFYRNATRVCNDYITNHTSSPSLPNEHQLTAVLGLPLVVGVFVDCSLPAGAAVKGSKVTVQCVCVCVCVYVCVRVHVLINLSVNELMHTEIKLHTYTHTDIRM